MAPVNPQTPMSEPELDAIFDLANRAWAYNFPATLPPETIIKLVSDFRRLRAEIALLIAPRKTCATCRHWNGAQEQTWEGECISQPVHRLTYVSVFGDATVTHELYTPPDFGCAWWASRIPAEGGSSHVLGEH